MQSSLPFVLPVPGDPAPTEPMLQAQCSKANGHSSRRNNAVVSFGGEEKNSQRCLSLCLRTESLKDHLRFAPLNMTKVNRGGLTRPPANDRVKTHALLPWAKSPNHLPSSRLLATRRWSKSRGWTPVPASFSSSWKIRTRPAQSKIGSPSR